jgi:uncharacterized protein YciI
MKYLLFFCLSLFSFVVVGQQLPSFLRGTWRIENSNQYEHWDELSEYSLKGFSYRLDEGKIEISEYLSISQTKRKIVYKATVIGHNDGMEISFNLTKSDSIWEFENKLHDFPQKITYHKLNDNELRVELKGIKNQQINYTLYRQYISNETDNPNFDAALAEKLGGDDYGMKSYIFVILKTGLNPSTSDKEEINNYFKGHMDNITKLVEQKKLVVAGPMGKNDLQYRGIFILSNVSSLEEAHKLLQTDPAIKSGLLDAELYNWYGSAALPEYLPFSDKIWKSKF